MLLTAYMLCFTAPHFMNMDNQNHHVNIFINNQDFTETNNLTYILGNEDSTEEIAEVKLSPFIDTQELCEKFYTVKSNLSIVSLNAQSIRAKFDEFQIAMNESIRSITLVLFAYKNHGYHQNVAQKCLNLLTIN